MELSKVNKLVNKQAQPLSNHYAVSKLIKNMLFPINHLGSLRQKEKHLMSHHDDTEN